MPLFEYIVRTEEGKRLEGKIDANSLNEANEKLNKKRYTIVKLNEKDYFDFLLESNEYDNTVEEQIHEIIKYYVLIRRRRVNLKITPKENLDVHI